MALTVLSIYFYIRQNKTSVIHYNCDGYTLKDYEHRVKLFRGIMISVDRYYLLYNFFYGLWIQFAYGRFQLEKCSNQIEAINFDDWVVQKCGVNRTKARQLRKFSDSFNKYQKVLHLTGS